LTTLKVKQNDQSEDSKDVDGVKVSKEPRILIESSQSHRQEEETK